MFSLSACVSVRGLQPAIFELRSWFLDTRFLGPIPRDVFPSFSISPFEKILERIYLIFGDFLMDLPHFFTIKMQQKIGFFWNLAGYWTIQSETDLRKLGTDWKNIYWVTLHLVSKNLVFLLINQTIFALKLTRGEIFFQYAVA